MKFQNSWSLIMAADTDFEANMTLSEKLFYIVGQFNAEVTNLVMQIVNDFSLPEPQRQYKAQTSLSPKHASLYDLEAHS